MKKSDIKVLFEMVKGSDHVVNNPDYREKSENTTIELESENDTINAYAMSVNQHSHFICIFNGLCNES